MDARRVGAVVLVASSVLALGSACSVSGRHASEPPDPVIAQLARPGAGWHEQSPKGEGGTGKAQGVSYVAAAGPTSREHVCRAAAAWLEQTAARFPGGRGLGEPRTVLVSACVKAVKSAEHNRGSIGGTTGTTGAGKHYVASVVSDVDADGAAVVEVSATVEDS